jgi:hypothetical protein
MATENRYWFAATPFGYGWWRPNHWLGWTTVIITIALVFVVGRLFPPETAPLYFWASIVAIVSCFLFVCKTKGEPLGRRGA